MEHLIAGVDEAGRGPLAGPVFAAAVILDSRKPIAGLADSKKLSAKMREFLFQEIKKNALSFAFASASVAEIDRINILQATFLAMQRAVSRLKINPHLILVDGNRAPSFPCQTVSIVRGDESEAVISAASIVAKVLRDRLMRKLDQYYPLYGFAQHKGYGTAQHLQALQLHGPCKVHRKSFSPVLKATPSEPSSCRDINMV